MARQASVHGKLLLVVLATTASALTITGAAMAFYDVHTFRQSWVTDLTAQADILGLAAAPALEFGDPGAADEYLALLAAKPNVTGAAIYTANGAILASYRGNDGKNASFPRLPAGDGYTIDGSQIELFKRIASDNEILGTVFIHASYGVAGRLLNYLGITGTVMTLSLLAAVLLSRRLQTIVTRPILQITSVARRVMDDRDFTSRAPKTTNDEIGILVDAFNGMLAEIASRTETLEQSNRELEREIADRKGAEQALHASEAELRRLNLELEERVAARTVQLEEANKDLEGFSYSVSHDLRAPIRAISGFCDLLQHDHADQLEDEARRKLGIIGSEAARMGRLIDDLLAFSRLGRKALQPVDLEMTEMAQKAFERLNTDGNVELRLSTLPAAVGDHNLFEQVWTNLLANAIKFSSRRDGPIVEVGGIIDESEHVYFVRDNGAGFDPRYRDRLFGVFQRLHNESDFPGTGVGLALVQRIVHRHGGRVWADGKLDGGATFHFTVPKEECSGGI